MRCGLRVGPSRYSFFNCCTILDQVKRGYFQNMRQSCFLKQPYSQIEEDLTVNFHQLYSRILRTDSSPVLYAGAHQTPIPLLLRKPGASNLLRAEQK